jgi:hypothetical protein
MLGTPSCDDFTVQWTMTATPDTAFIVYGGGDIDSVDLATLACARVFNPGQAGIGSDYGLAAVGNGPSAKLFVYGIPGGSSGPTLAVIDVSSFSMTLVGGIDPAPPPSSFPVNLTADTTGQLFAYSPGGFVQKIDPTRGNVVQSRQTDVVTGSTWATIAYSTELYLWADSRVVGYDLATGAHTSDRDVGIFAIGASSFVACSK